MSTQATVRNIGAPKNGIGVVYREELPANALHLEGKYCELCGRYFVRKFAPTEPIVARERDFSLGYGGRPVYSSLTHEVVRRRDRGERLCRKCHGATSLELSAENLLTAQEQYKAQLPDDREARKRHVYSMPDYRHLNPVGRATASHKINEIAALQRRKMRRLSPLEQDKWQACVRALLRERPATMEELCELIPNASSPQEASIRLRYASIVLQRVGNAPRRAEKGPYPGLFVLASPQETVH